MLRNHYAHKVLLILPEINYGGSGPDFLIFAAGFWLNTFVPSIKFKVFILEIVSLFCLRCPSLLTG
jgi:hypothetical protein